MEENIWLSITYALLTLLLTYFVVIAFQCHSKNDSYTDYFLAKKQLGSGDNAVSYFARFTSLATVLTFFFIFTSIEGVYIVVAPITVFLGVLLFNKLVKGFRPIDSSCSSIVEHLYKYYKNSMLATITSYLLLLAILLVLLLEVYVGSRILEAIFPLPKDGFFSIFIVGVVVFSYVAVGGLRSIVATDRVQMFAIFSFVVASIAILGVNVVDVNYSDLFPRSAVSLEPIVVILPLALMLNILIVNLFLFPSLYSTWQMRFATADNDQFLSGNLKGATSVLLIWSIFIAIGLLMKVEFGKLPFSLGELATIMGGSESQLIQYIIAPLLIVAAISALFSTADSGVIPIVQMIYDKKYKKEEFSYIKTGGIAAVLMVSIFVLYAVVFVVLEFDFVKAMFSVFGFSVILSPMILWSIVFPEDPYAEQRSGIFLFGILLGLLGMGIMIVLGSINGDTGIVQLAPVIGFTLVGLVLLFSYLGQGSPRKALN